MGNCCGKADGNFGGEGRVLGDASDAPARPVQSKPQRSTQQGGRTLGQGPSPGLAPGEAAAQAAEARAKATGGAKGSLGQKLNAQKAQSHSTTLAQNARENLAARDADAAAQTRSYN